MVKKFGVLFSGGKDSVYATYLAKKTGYEISCLISMFSENKESYMFHTPSIEMVKEQAKVMNLPLLVFKTKGEKEKELIDLENAIKSAKEKFNITGIITGAIKSKYQSDRIKKICDKLNLECFNPLWQKNENDYLYELIKLKFEVIIVGVFAYPLNETWLLKKIDDEFIDKIKIINEKYKVNIAGEGGEFETYVLNCPLFSNKLNIIDKKIIKEGENSFRAEIIVK